MRKNKVEVFLGKEQVLLDNAEAAKVQATEDKELAPFHLFNRANHPVKFKYGNDTRIISPKGKLFLGDISKLEKESLDKNLMFKESK